MFTTYGEAYFAEERLEPGVMHLQGMVELGLQNSSDCIGAGYSRESSQSQSEHMLSGQWSMFAGDNGTKNNIQFHPFSFERFMYFAS